jgi:hypothetical protein
MEIKGERGKINYFLSHTQKQLIALFQMLLIFQIPIMLSLRTTWQKIIFPKHLYV